MVDDLVPRSIELVGQAALRDRHAYRVREALAERACGRLDARCQAMLWMAGRFGFGPGERVLQKTPFGFDASVWEFFAPLLQE